MHLDRYNYDGSHMCLVVETKGLLVNIEHMNFYNFSCAVLFRSTKNKLNILWLRILYDSLYNIDLIIFQKTNYMMKNLNNLNFIKPFNPTC